MAQMYPIKEDISEMPYSELRVYELLSALGENFTVFHSVQWVKRGSKWKSTWKENDFLIFNRNLGGLVLEVKGGDIDCRGGVFYQKNTETGEINVLDPQKKKDPLSQAIDGIYHYRQLLDTISPDLSDRFPIEAVAWFPSCTVRDNISKFPLKYREVAGAVLGEEDFSIGSAAIYNVFNFYSNREKVKVSEEEYEKILDMIATDFKLISAPGVRKGELDRAFLNEYSGVIYTANPDVETDDSGKSETDIPA